MIARFRTKVSHKNNNTESGGGDNDDWVSLIVCFFGVAVEYVIGGQRVVF